MDFARGLFARCFGAVAYVMPSEGTQHWDEAILRHVHEQDVEVRGALPSFDVIFDAHDQIIGFVDQEGWDHCAEAPVELTMIQRRLVETGLVAADAAVVELARGPQGCREVIVHGDGHVWRARINPVTQRVIALEPWTMA